MGLISSILGIFSALSSVFGRLLEIVKENTLVNWGREQHASDLAKEEIEINRKQTEILNQDRTKEDVVKRMEDGIF
jgi:hypothetical protein